MNPPNPNDFNDFASAHLEPPRDLNEKLLLRVNHELHPPLIQVFAKVASIHFIVGMLTLLVCPQFGVRILGDGMGLMNQFMIFGDLGCRVACGLFFFSSSMLVAALLLRREEMKALRQNQILGVSTLALLSLGVFTMAHAEVVAGFAIAWLFGSVLGGWMSLQVISWFRFKETRAFL